MLDILLYSGLVFAGYIIGDVVGWLSALNKAPKIEEDKQEYKSYSHLRDRSIVNSLSKNKNLTYNYKAEQNVPDIYDAEIVGDSIKINEII